MITRPLIKSVAPKGILSFGPDTPPLQLGMLNVLIGPNASGKSNLLDVFELVRKIPTDIQSMVQSGGGARSWLWENDPALEPSLELTVNPGDLELQHRLVLRSIKSELWPVSEQIRHLPDTLLYDSKFDSRRAQIRVRTREPEQADPRSSPPFQPGPGLRWVPISPIGPQDSELIDFGYPVQENQSILSQLRSQFDYPQMTILSGVYNAIQF